MDELTQLVVAMKTFASASVNYIGRVKNYKHNTNFCM